MLIARGTGWDVGCGARVGSLSRSGVAARRELAAGGVWGDTRLRDGGGAAALAQNSACASLSIANCGRRGRLIRKKIIGHGLHGFAASIAVCRRFLRHRVLALMHQQSRQQRRSVLFQPGIQQLGDLLAEIGGVVQAREFVALQGIAGSGEQELPRGLSFVIQGGLRAEQREIISNITTINSTKYVRSVEKCAKFCSGWRARGACDAKRRAQS
jgi:hypothetical protein